MALTIFTLYCIGLLHTTEWVWHASDEDRWQILVDRMAVPTHLLRPILVHIHPDGTTTWEYE